MDRRRSIDPQPEEEDAVREAHRLEQKRNTQLKKLELEIAEMERKLLEAKEQYADLKSSDSGANELKRYRVVEEMAAAKVRHKDNINIIMDGKVGSIPRTNIIYFSDVKDAVNNKSQDVQFGGNYQMSRFGEKEFLHPPGVTWRASNKFGEYEYSKNCMDKLFSLMSGERCTFSETAQLYFGCGYHCNSGGSDEAAINIQAATLRGLFHDIGIDHHRISNLMIAKSLPSRTQVRNIELKLGASCFLCICWEIDKDGCGYISWQFDHGKRKGREHFIKVISWGGIDEIGNHVIKSYCVDASACGHSAEEASTAIKETNDLITTLLPDIISSSASSDSGGGSSINNVYPRLIQLGVLLAGKCTKNHCECHGANKPLEVGLKDALGDAGIGHDSPWQLLHLSDTFLDQLKEDYGIKRVDSIWGEINLRLINNERFQQECTKHGGLSFNDYYEAIQTSSDEDPDCLSCQLFSCPTNRRDPVFSRWLTLLFANDVFLEHYYTLYLLGVKIKTDAKSGSLLHTYACNMLALMRIKPEASYDNTDDEAPPVFYTVLLFVQGFSRSFFMDHFNWIMRSNPNFGNASYGFLSPYCPEHAYVMDRDLESLENGGYKTNPHFAPYLKVLETVPIDHDVRRGGSAYFERFTKVFFTSFRASFNKHILDHWFDEEHLVYCIGGTPSVAKEFLRYLNSIDVEEEQQSSEDGDGNLRDNNRESTDSTSLTALADLNLSGDGEIDCVSSLLNGIMYTNITSIFKLRTQMNRMQMNPVPTDSSLSSKMKMSYFLIFK